MNIPHLRRIVECMIVGFMMFAMVNQGSADGNPKKFLISLKPDPDGTLIVGLPVDICVTVENPLTNPPTNVAAISFGEEASVTPSVVISVKKKNDPDFKRVTQVRFSASSAESTMENPITMLLAPGVKMEGLATLTWHWELMDPPEKLVFFEPGTYEVRAEYFPLTKASGKHGTTIDYSFSISAQTELTIGLPQEELDKEAWARFRELDNLWILHAPEAALLWRERKSMRIGGIKEFIEKYGTSKYGRLAQIAFTGEEFNSLSSKQDSIGMGSIIAKLERQISEVNGSTRIIAQRLLSQMKRDFVSAKINNEASAPKNTILDAPIPLPPTKEQATVVRKYMADFLAAMENMDVKRLGEFLAEDFITDTGLGKASYLEKLSKEIREEVARDDSKYGKMKISFEEVSIQKIEGGFVLIEKQIATRGKETQTKLLAVQVQEHDGRLRICKISRNRDGQ